MGSGLAGSRERGAALGVMLGKTCRHRRRRCLPAARAPCGVECTFNLHLATLPPATPPCAAVLMAGILVGCTALAVLLWVALAVQTKRINERRRATQQGEPPRCPAGHEGSPGSMPASWARKDRAWSHVHAVCRWSTRPGLPALPLCSRRCQAGRHGRAGDCHPARRQRGVWSQAVPHTVRQHAVRCTAGGARGRRLLRGAVCVLHRSVCVFVCVVARAR